jgi:PAS domain S-box-containing protein
MNANGIHISEWVAALDIRKPFYLAIMDEEGFLSFTNSRFYTQFLSAPGSSVHASFFDLVPQSDQASFKEILAVSALQEEPITTEIRINSGLCRWVKWEVSCISSPGQRGKYLCMGYDIADEVQIKRTEEILGLNYQTIVEDMNVGILLQDTEGNIITANQKAAEIFSTTLEELYTAKDLPLLCKAGAGEQLALAFEETAFSKTLRTGEAQTNVVIKVPLSRGRYRTLLCNWQPLFENTQSAPYSVLSTFQDISKEKEFEKEAQARTALFSAFMDHTPYFTWIVDKEENLVFANKALLDYFQTDESVFGKKLTGIIPGPIAGMIREKHQNLRHGSQDRSVIKCQMADGKEHVYQVIVFPVGLESPDSLVGGEALDITEAYLAREQEKIVSERLRALEAQLAEHRLSEQKGIAEAIIRAQEDERTRIGHELHDNINQILASGQLYLGVLNQDIDDFQIVKSKAMEILQLAIEEVQALSRAMVLPDLKKGGLMASIDNLVEDLRFGSPFMVDFSHSPAWELEEMSQSKKVTLFRIIQEQTKNILKYSKAKTMSISLNMDNNWVRLEIKDDGVGFDPDNSRRGLGLSNIYERTRLYEGRVRLNTAPGKGCSIVVTMPTSSRDHESRSV